MHEHTRHRRRWKWGLPWHWDTYTSPSGKFVMRWRGPLVTSSMTYWEHDFSDTCTVAACGHYAGDGCATSWYGGDPSDDDGPGCGASFIIGGVSE